ncbi:MAG: TonB-dependent receptor, partial [Bdellovibrionales bacterium]|nr:TonB-dependent receptor [Bdellovibrionales bacterium]
FAEFETPLATRGRSVLGFEGFIDENKGERAGAVYGLFPNGETTQYGIYAQQPVDLGESFSLLAGLRADFYESKPSNTALATNEGSALSPKLYLTWETLKTETSEQSVFAGWGRGFNAPRIQDLYVSGLHFPGQPPMVPNNFFQANPNLKPEVADTFELGLRGRAQADSNPWSYSLVAFLTEANDFIVRDVNMTAGTTRLSNIDRATLYGAELHLHKTLARWSFEVSASTIRGLNRRADEPIADTPADRTAFLVGYAITDSLVLGADTEIVLDQERVPNGTLATGGYTLFNSSLNWKPSNDLTLNAKVTNLSNRAYRRHGSQIDDAGQDIRVAVTARF